MGGRALRLPQRLRDLLADAPEESEVLALAGRTYQLLTDNKTPFFPDYTDHGITHVEQVLDAAVRLVPQGGLSSAT